MSDEILHYGKKRRSGRYPWGSGKVPQRSLDMISKVDKYRQQGLTEPEIAAAMNMSTTKLRSEITWANKERREYLKESVKTMHEDGKSKTEIAERLGIAESSVRNYLNSKDQIKEKQLDNIVKTLKEGVKKNEYLDVGSGTEVEMGISEEKLKTALNELKKDGYYVNNVYINRLQDPNNKLTVKVLSKENDVKTIVRNSDKIKSVEAGTEDGGLTMTSIKPPKNVSWKRVAIKYGDEGGSDKDGIIELRPGVKDLDLGKSRYAQVRIAVNGTHYLKGMAMYSNNLPEGVDIRFNTNKKKGTPKEEVLKELKKNKDNPFGATIKPRGQKGALNIVNEEGDWSAWKSTLSSQFLSKQPLALAKDRLSATFKNVNKNYDEIMKLNNPVVKKHMLEQFASDADSKMHHLKAMGLPNTRGHVILPFPEMKANEVYAPNYKDGDRVVLVRYPHGGTFELPELTVNNKGPASKYIKNASDAIGIHPSVAKKLSGADFDGDSVYVIPNNAGKVKTSKSLKALENFDPNKYQVDHKTITDKGKQIQMGMVSNLITDMTIKKASTAEIASAVKHSMVVIDSEKHNLNWKQSAIDNNIAALSKKYQTRVNPLSKDKKPRVGASTLISVQKKVKVPVTSKKTGKTKLVDKSIYDLTTLDKISSGSAMENIYSDYISKLQSIKNEALKESMAIPSIKRDPAATKKYSKEVISLNNKLNTSLSNAPRERRAQILANKYYYKNLDYDMSKDQKKKLKSQSVARARMVAQTLPKDRKVISITDKEWEAIQANALSNHKLEQILTNADADRVKELATPREKKVMTSGKIARAKAMIDNGNTIANVADALGVSVTTLRDAIA